MTVLVRSATRRSTTTEHVGPDMFQGGRAAITTQEHVQGRCTAEDVRRARGAQIVDQWNRTQLAGGYLSSRCPRPGRASPLRPDPQT